jgi:hypothetical protein
MKGYLRYMPLEERHRDGCVRRGRAHERERERERERDGVQYLSTAIAHLLSMKSVALSNVAGHARAVMSPPNTVYIAPRFINCEAAAAGIQTNNKSQRKGFTV